MSFITPLYVILRKRIKNWKTKSNIYLDDINVWIDKNYWFMNEEADKRKPFHTQPFEQLYALREALKIISYEGLESIWQRHATVHEYTARNLNTELPQLQPFVQNESDRHISYFVLKARDNYKVGDIVDYMSEKYEIQNLVLEIE